MTGASRSRCWKTRCGSRRARRSRRARTFSLGAGMRKEATRTRGVARGRSSSRGRCRTRHGRFTTRRFSALRSGRSHRARRSRRRTGGLNSARLRAGAGAFPALCERVSQGFVEICGRGPPTDRSAHEAVARDQRGCPDVLTGVKPRAESDLAQCRGRALHAGACRSREGLRARRPHGSRQMARWRACAVGANVRQWTESNTGAAAHAPVERTISLDALDQPGTYLVEARAGGLWGARADRRDEAGRDFSGRWRAGGGVSLRCEHGRARDRGLGDGVAGGMARQSMAVGLGGKRGPGRPCAPRSADSGRAALCFRAGGGQPAGACAMDAGSKGEKAGDALLEDGSAREIFAGLTVSRAVTTPGKIVKISLETRGSGGESRPRAHW